jgi:ribosomal protein S18 acetylase RimI-like enzyme
MNVRKATLMDAPDIARLHIASWRATYLNELPPDFLAQQDLEVRTARWRARFAKGIHVLLAEEAGALVGFVSFGPAHDPESFKAGDWEIHSLHVDPARHGQGIGRELFEQAVRACHEQLATGVMLWVVRTNRHARSFYERMGMRHDGGEQDHTVAPGIVFHEVRYRLPLATIKD